jgi:Rieske 2Fe-2S family protein
MARDPRTTVESLLAARRRGHSLEAPFYTDPEIFALDLEHIFQKHWIFVGVEGDVPEPGDYFTVEIGAVSVIVLRDDDMNLAAFHNVCRHRGARLPEER